MDNTRTLYFIDVMQTYSNHRIHPGPSPVPLEFEHQVAETERKTCADGPTVFSSSTCKDVQVNILTCGAGELLQWFGILAALQRTWFGSQSPHDS